MIKRRAMESPSRKKARLAREAQLQNDLLMLPHLEDAISSLKDEGEIAPKNVWAVIAVLATKVGSIEAAKQPKKPSKKY